VNSALIALGLSIALNAGLGWAYLGQRDTIATLRTEAKAVQGQLQGARADAKACSDAVDDLRTLADQRAKEASAARDAAQQRAQGHQRKADAILAAQPAVPGDDCASARLRVDGWLKGRAEP
jgi:septal ring factor EnvC (AmiA/AmiB activator)